MLCLLGAHRRPSRPSPKAVSVQSMDGLCKRYLREHHGHPGKAIDVVKVVHVDCSEKQ